MQRGETRGGVETFPTAKGVSGYMASLWAASIRPPKVGREVWHHLASALSTSVVPVVLVLGPFGMVVALQGLEILRVFGTERLLSSVIGLAIIRELSPALTAMILAAQAGSGAAAEIASMRVSSKWDALEVMATPPRKYIVLPRICAIALAAPILTMIGSLAGIFGGLVVEVLLKGFALGTFLDALTGFLTPWDLVGSVIKSMVFGALAGILAAYHGEQARGGARGVGLATNRAVVAAVATMLVANYLLSTLFFGSVSS